MSLDNSVKSIDGSSYGKCHRHFDIHDICMCVCVYAKKVNCLLCSILMDGTPDQLHIEQLLCEEECEEDGLFYYMLSTVAI